MDNLRRKALILTSTFPRQDGDTDPPFVFDLAKRLTRSYDIMVLCPHAPGTRAYETVAGIRVKRFRYFWERYETLAYGAGILNRFRQSRLYYGLVPFFLLAELAATMATIVKFKPDIINAHWLIPQGLVAIAAKMLIRSKCPLVCTLHGGDIFGLKGPLLDMLKRFVLRRCDAVNVVSSAMAATAADLGAAPACIHVIPMGVDLQKRFQPGAVTRKPKSLLFVGRFAEKKGLTHLLEAMPAVLQRHPEAGLYIVGHGPLEDAVRKRIKALGIKGAVTILGAMDHEKLPAVYQSCQIFIFPSIIDDRGDTEGFGLVMVEAMGCGCTVIASDLPAIRDSIIDGTTGVLCPQKDSAALAATIIALLDDPARCDALAQQGLQYARARFDWDITVEKYLAVFNKTCNQA